MEDKEKVQSFGDMVSATEKLTKPWRIAVVVVLIALILTNAFWAFVHWKQLQYAYMTPTEWSQEQQFEEQTQNQHYSDGATNGG